MGSTIKLSVRSFVEFLLRSGDLTSGFSSSGRAVEGGRIHRQIQKEQGAAYQAEVALTFIAESNGLRLEIGGRADGIIVGAEYPGQIIIDEIKSTTKNIELLDENEHPLYWAQAQCYAFIYAEQEDLPEVTVQLTYCQFVTREIRRFSRTYERRELAEFFHGLLARYFAWAERLSQWLSVRNQSAGELAFPFSHYRAGQRALSVAVYRTIVSGRKLYAQAPTGIGKTMATIFPAVKAIGQGLTEKIFFLTAKTVTRGLAEEAFARLRGNGLRCKTVTLTAKEKICFTPGAACTAAECRYAAGYYDRVNDAIADAWRMEAFTREVVEEYAEKHQICPFEFSLDLSLWMDAIICDYNYVFDPQVYLRRFFQEDGGAYCFLIDEAHNLVDRARDMFSAELTKKPFLAMKRLLKEALPAVAKAAGVVNACFLAIGKLCEEEGEEGFLVNREPPQDLFPLLRKFVGQAEDWLMKNEQADFKEDLLEVYFAAHAFLRVGEMVDDRYTTYVDKSSEDVRIKLFCVDPSLLLRAALARGQAAIFFSATLTPLTYFSAILGGGEEDGRLAVPSPFPRSHLCLLLHDAVSTTYKKRTQTYEDVVACIAAAIAGKTGNYLVFLPSYQYLEDVCRRFCEAYPHVAVIAQSGGMTEQERLAFLAAFSAEPQCTLVGFAVMGGVFGEGIDLVGERLSGAVIVGVGLPQLSRERDIIRSFFQEENGQGFAYAYLYPGMNKVLQAAGRVIRSESDKGVVLLIDERFAHSRYRSLFPAEWRGMVRTKECARIAVMVQSFWQ